QPVLPMVGGPYQALVGVLVVLRRRAAAPGQGAEANIALLEQGVRPGAAPFQPDPDVRGEGERQVAALELGGNLVEPPVSMPPPCVVTPVVKYGLAIQGDLHRPMYAADRPEQHVLRVIVGRGSAVRGFFRLLVPPRSYHQAVPDDDPALAAVPAGLENHRSGQVPAGGLQR